jgi:hypothetical protein
VRVHVGRAAAGTARALARVSPRRRRTRRRLDRVTLGLAVVALGTCASGVGGEVARVWRRGSAPMPGETEDVLAAAEEAARETVEVAIAGYRETPPRETAVVNLLFAYVITFGCVRLGAALIRARGTFGPFRNVMVGRSHIHHFVPGIALAFVSGGAALLTRDHRVESWLAIPFGAGVAMTLDESALLLRLEDVYWTEEGILSVQITLAALALLGALARGRRLARRGEARVLPD